MVNSGGKTKVKQGFFDWIIASISLAIFVLTFVYWQEQIWLLIATGALTLLFFFWGAFRYSRSEEDDDYDKYKYINETDNRRQFIQGKIRHLILLNENNEEMNSWDIFGKTAIVIGRDEGNIENDVTIDLSKVTYAGFIEVEHAVLNYVGEHWYIEDLHSTNGVRVEKRGESRAYKLATDKPCLLESGDIIYIGRTKLLIQ